MISIHSSSLQSILNRKAITKEILFRYLTQNSVQIRSINSTKLDLVEQILQFWNADEQRENFQQMRLQSFPEENFPINVMARQFSEWYFKNWNDTSLTSNDFWADCSILLRLTDSSNSIEEEIQGNQNVHHQLHELRAKYNLFFNPNNTHEGIQGRFDPHGLVFVLTCGTIHTTELCVGIFEAVFVLARDPFAENNWKVKSKKIIVCSKQVTLDQPTLNDCPSLQELVILPHRNVNV